MNKEKIIKEYNKKRSKEFSKTLDFIFTIVVLLFMFAYPIMLFGFTWDIYSNLNYNNRFVALTLVYLFCQIFANTLIFIKYVDSKDK